MSMWMLCGVGIIVKGHQASRYEAPILVTAPHSTFLDAIVIYVAKMSSPVVRDEDRNLGSKLMTWNPL